MGRTSWFAAGPRLERRRCRESIQPVPTRSSALVLPDAIYQINTSTGNRNVGSAHSNPPERICERERNRVRVRRKRESGRVAQPDGRKHCGRDRLRPGSRAAFRSSASPRADLDRSCRRGDRHSSRLPTRRRHEAGCTKVKTREERSFCWRWYESVLGLAERGLGAERGDFSQLIYGPCLIPERHFRLEDLGRPKPMLVANPHAIATRMNDTTTLRPASGAA